MKRSIIAFALSLLSTTSWAQGINPITPPANWMVQIVSPSQINPSNFYATLPSLPTNGINISSTTSFASTPFILSPTITSGNGTRDLDLSPILAPSSTFNNLAVLNINGSVTSGTTATNYIGAAITLTTTASYTGTITNGFGLQIQAPVIGGTNPVTNYTGVNINPVSNGNGITNGTVTNVGLGATVFTAAAASGGTVTNAGVSTNLGTGSGAGTTNNYGLLIQGNGGTGGGGTTNNFAINSTSTAPSSFSGSISATLASAVGTNAVCNTPGTATALTVQIWATGCAASSARFKEGIASLSGEKALADVLAFQPVQYYYKPETNMGSDLHVGFTAEQIGSIDPQWITFESDGVTPHAVKYNEMVPLLTAALQQLNAEFQAYKKSHF